MDYNENEFKEKANRKARRIWFVFAILLSANYGSDVSKGLNTASYYFCISGTLLDSDNSRRDIA